MKLKLPPYNKISLHLIIIAFCFSASSVLASNQGKSAGDIAVGVEIVFNHIDYLAELNGFKALICNPKKLVGEANSFKAADAKQVKAMASSFAENAKKLSKTLSLYEKKYGADSATSAYSFIAADRDGTNSRSYACLVNYKLFVETFKN